MRILAAAAVSLALAATGVLAGCGSDGTDVRATSPGSSTEAPASTTPTPQRRVAPPLPRCATVWRTGKVLPHSYRGCVRAGEAVEPRSRSCSSGQRLDSFGAHFYAARGAQVRWVADLRHDATFQRALESCSG
jgi:hypothetical protein